MIPRVSLLLALLPWSASPARAASCVLTDTLSVQVDLLSEPPSAVEQHRYQAPEACSSASIVLPEGFVLAPGLTLENGEVRAASGESLPEWVVAERTLPAVSALGSGRISLPASRDVRPTTVQLTAPLDTPLSVWSDPTADVAVHTVPHTSSRQRDGQRVVALSWPLRPSQAPELAWSTLTGWEPAQATLKQVSRSVRPRSSELAELGSLSDKSPEAITRLVQDALGMDPPAAGETWLVSRSIADILRSGHANPAERGAVLLAALRAAGFDAEPASWAPADGHGAPLTLPTPDHLTLPALLVRTPKGDVWIDPASPYSALPALPNALQGAIALLPDAPPVVLGDTRAPTPEVQVTGRISVLSSGQTQWVATVRATGAGAEVLRTWLLSLDGPAQEAALLGLVTVARPETQGFTWQVTGLTDALAPLEVSLSGHVPDRFEERGRSLVVGDTPAMLAPMLAAALPAGVRVREALSIELQRGRPIALVQPRPEAHPAVVMSRTIRTVGAEAVLTTAVLRPRPASGPVDELGAARFLRSASSSPSRLILGRGKAKAALADLRELELASAEEAVLRAVISFGDGDLKGGERALRAALRQHPYATVAALLQRYAVMGDLAPWDALYGTARTDEDKLNVVDGMEAAGLRRQAWILATQLATSEQLNTRARAMTAMARLQGARVDARIDAEAYRAWKDPLKLLTAAQRAGYASLSVNAEGGPPPTAELGLPSVWLPLAVAMTDDSKALDALPLVEAALARDPSARARAVAAYRGSSGDQGTLDVVAQLAAALEDAPMDPEVHSLAARALLRVQHPREAVDHALAAAWLDPNPEQRWVEATELALQAGDLGAALFATREACALAPTDIAQHVRLYLLGLAAGDAEAIARGKEVSGYASELSDTPSLEPLLGLLDPSWHLAVLRARDAEVVADAQRLRQRLDAQQKLGMSDAAWRDAQLLRARHGQADALVAQVAAEVGSLWSTEPDPGLSRAISSPEVRLARMELRLLTGLGDPLADARALPRDARAKALLDAAKDPAKLAADAPLWPTEIKEPSSFTAPPGFAPNDLLGAVEGVVAYTDAERGVTVLVTGKPTGALPPPLAQLYGLSRPIERLPAGGEVVRLAGGVLPAYAAITVLDRGDLIGLGLTPNAARVALREALAHAEAMAEAAPKPEPD